MWSIFSFTHWNVSRILYNFNFRPNFFSFFAELQLRFLFVLERFRSGLEWILMKPNWEPQLLMKELQMQMALLRVELLDLNWLGLKELVDLFTFCLSFVYIFCYILTTICLDLLLENYCLHFVYILFTFCLHIDYFSWTFAYISFTFCLQFVYIC